jgi:sarcosine oxidase, subunit beta
VSGLYYAFGFCAQGFQLGPGVGDVMAELIDTGLTRTPIEPFDVRRFAAMASPAQHGRRSRRHAERSSMQLRQQCSD